MADEMTVWGRIISPMPTREYGEFVPCANKLLFDNKKAKKNNNRGVNRNMVIKYNEKGEIA
jgi:hypothetical protein